MSTFLSQNYVLTLAFSCTGDRLERLLGLLDKLKDSPVEVIVVMQRWSPVHQQLAESFRQVRFVWSETVGLSRSRNIAIDASNTPYIWLLDDDVDIVPEELSALIKMIESSKTTPSVYRVRVGCTECHESFYKRYDEKSKVSKLSVLRMNSIELIICREFVVQNGIRFNSRIGLGTDFPGSEEIHFLLDVVEARGKFELVHKPFVYHSCTEGGRLKVESDSIMEIRGATASRLGAWGPFLVSYWGLRYLLRDKRISVVFSLIKGYLKGYRAYI